MTQKALIAIDQGTSSTRSVIFSTAGKPLAQFSEEIPLSYPQKGWVEMDCEALLTSVTSTLHKAFEFASNNAIDIAGIGLTNQRETTILWNKEDGKAVYPAIIWQDSRTSAMCTSIKEQQPDLEELLHQKTGLFLDPYFSATKIAWILDNAPEAKTLSAKGTLAFGTVDSFIIWHLTGGQTHATDHTNASRTLLYNLSTKGWDRALLSTFNIPASLLPEIRNCDASFGTLKFDNLPSVPLCGVAGDQQAALIGQQCFTPGTMKSTYGTGCFMMANIGQTLSYSKHQLLTTVGFAIGNDFHYALEGSIFSSGSIVRWLRDQLGMIDDAKDTEACASAVESANGVYLIPAFNGLGAPHWRSDLQASIHGITQDTNRNHIVRACLESIAYQTFDLINAMQQDGLDVTSLNIDGGMVANRWFNQFLADIMNITITRPQTVETTAQGAAYLAGLHLGIYADLSSLEQLYDTHSTYSPKMDDITRDKLLSGWQATLERALH